MALTSCLLQHASLAGQKEIIFGAFRMFYFDGTLKSEIDE